MSDIVERLGEASNSDAPLSIGEHWNLEDEAADEIERLRVENEKLARYRDHHEFVASQLIEMLGDVRDLGALVDSVRKLKEENATLHEAFRNHAEEAAKMVNAKVSGERSESAGLPGYAAGGNGEQE